jgi:hypothetical protein
MTDPTPEQRFEQVVAAVRDTPGVTEPAGDGGRKFGGDALKVGGKIFAMMVQGRLVVKLPRARVDALIAAGDGNRFDPGHGRVMKEWLSLHPDSREGWIPLVREALTFVGPRER